GNNYLDREIFIDKNTNDLYLDVFKNLKVSNEINSLKVKSFNEKCYSITFYGYYTRPDGEGEKLIDENGSLIILDINDFIENGKWIAENGQNLYAYYKIEPKEFKVTFDTIKSGGELSTVQTDYYVKYLTKDLLDKNQNIKDIPIAYKRLQGYTITFLGYKNKNDEFVIEYKDEQFKIVPNINGFTDENSNFIFSEDVILYATFKEDIITYDAYYYNYDGTIFEVIDLNLNDYLILPSSNPTKVLDNGKEYLFKYWIGYNYNTTTIMKDSKHFYPYFEEYDKREISDEGKTVFVNTFENIAKVYIKDFDNVERLKISLNNYKFEFDKNFCQMLFLNEFKSYGDCLILEVKEINNLEENKTLYNDLFNYKTYQISIKINETLVNLSGRIEIEINQILQDEEPKKAFTVNQKFKTKNEIDSAYKESKITFILSSLSDEIIIVANQDLSKQGNFIKTLLKIAIFLVLGIIFLVIIVVIVKKVIVILEDKKYNEKFSKQDLVSTSQNTEMDLKQQEFFEKLGTNSLLTKATKTNNQQFSQEEKSKQILQDKQDQDRLKNLKEKLENEKNKDN
ncbi:MAG: hypothetical protein IJW82_01345, partial [Clostridia bacterium]|nr:hypothetical protein [Clostridia bacterium]